MKAYMFSYGNVKKRGHVFTRAYRETKKTETDRQTNGDGEKKKTYIEAPQKWMKKKERSREIVHSQGLTHEDIDTI